MSLEREHSAIPNNIIYKSLDEKQELYDKLRQHLQPALSTEFQLSSINDDTVKSELALLADIRGLVANQMPEIAFVRIIGTEGSEHFTILRHKAHMNITSMFNELDNREPSMDTLSAHPGLLASYPSVLFDVKKENLPQFIDGIVKASTPEGYALLVDRFGIRRTDKDFWARSDELHSDFQKNNPINYGLLDYNRLQNR